MLKGDVVTLRPIEEADLETIYRLQVNVEARGDYFPRFVESAVGLRKQYQENGFWSRDGGAMAIVDNATRNIIGELFFFRTVPYMSELEIGYINFDPEARSKGAITEALGLATNYFFETLSFNRIRLVIATENKASRRVAEKNGYRHEGTMRACWFQKGRYMDGELYAITRADLESAAEA